MSVDIARTWRVQSAYLRSIDLIVHWLFLSLFSSSLLIVSCTRSTMFCGCSICYGVSQRPRTRKTIQGHLKRDQELLLNHEHDPTIHQFLLDCIEGNEKLLEQSKRVRMPSMCHTTCIPTAKPHPSVESQPTDDYGRHSYYLLNLLC